MSSTRTPTPSHRRRASLDLPLRRAILVVVAAAALTAVLAGLARLGVVTGLGVSHAVDHGPLFVVGMFGTVIALERAVALGKSVALVVPALGASSAVAMLAGIDSLAHVLAVTSTLGLVALHALAVKREPAPFAWLGLAGALALAAGTTWWAMGHPVFESALAFVAFFVGIIVGERVELASGVAPRWATRAIVVLVASFAVLACAAIACAATGIAIAGIAIPGIAIPGIAFAGIARAAGAILVVIGAWQLVFDDARGTLNDPGLPRYTAIAVLFGAAWLCVSGVILVVAALPAAGPTYDAALHAVFLGFTMSMLFAHAPIVFPSVAQIALPFHRALYAPLALLHAGLAVRLAGDAGNATLRLAGAWATASALALFAAIVVAMKLARFRRVLPYLVRRA